MKLNTPTMKSFIQSKTYVCIFIVLVFNLLTSCASHEKESKTDFKNSSSQFGDGPMNTALIWMIVHVGFVYVVAIAPIWVPVVIVGEAVSTLRKYAN